MSTPGSIKQTKVRNALQQLAADMVDRDEVQLLWRQPGAQGAFCRWTGICKGRVEGEPKVEWAGFQAPVGEVIFPPAEPLRYSVIKLRRANQTIFELTGPAVEKRPREDDAIRQLQPQHIPQNTGNLSDLIQSQQDVASGYKNVLTQVATGLRMNIEVPQEDRWLVPHLWRDDGERLVLVIKEQFQTAGCVVRTAALQRDLDVDYAILTDLLCLPRASKKQLFVVYAVFFRILAKFFMTASSQKAGRQVSQKFLHKSHGEWNDGRLDLAALFHKYRFYQPDSETEEENGTDSAEDKKADTKLSKSQKKKQLKTKNGGRRFKRTKKTRFRTMKTK